MLIALKVALTYLLIFAVDETFAWQTLVRPIIVGPIMGLVLGDVKTGIIMGASLEAIYMGIVNSGGAAPSDAFSATVICVTMVIVGGLDMKAGLAFAMPIGTIMQQLSPLSQPIHAYFVKIFDSYCEKGETRKFEILQQSYRFLIARLVQVVVIFLCIAIGVDKMQGFMDIMPTFILAGLKAAGNMLPAVGMGILAMMTWSKEEGMFLLIGFVLAAYLKLDSMAIALLGASICVIEFFKLIKASEGTNISAQKEEFFQ